MQLHSDSIPGFIDFLAIEQNLSRHTVLAVSYTHLTLPTN